MSRLVSRILLSMFVMPLGCIAFGCIIAAAETLHGYGDGNVDIGIAVGGCWVIVAAYWCLVWRTGVVWTNKRIGLTLGAAGAALVAGLAMAAAFVLLIGPHSSFEFTPVLAFGGVLAILFWLMATVIIWRETTAERMARVANSSKSAISCPVCGYNLTGLREVRCPECGATFTLDELLASQPGKEASDVE